MPDASIDNAKARSLRVAEDHLKSGATNEELLTYLCKWAPLSGAMAQVFILDAIEKQADRILADPDAVREQMKGSFIHPDSWIAAAIDVKQALEARR